jgi:hypothetical protein
VLWHAKVLYYSAVRARLLPLLSPAFRGCSLGALRRKSRLEYPFLGLFFFVSRDFSALACFLQLLELTPCIRRAVEFFLGLTLKDFAKRDDAPYRGQRR